MAYTEEKGLASQYQKWDWITLSDFRTGSCKTTLSFGWLWFLAGVAISVYIADTFTAVNLLVYDKWSGEIKPPIPFAISKWIFAGCILFSWLLCFYEWIRAIRVIRGGNVAESYLDPLAVTLQSMRCDGFGYRRFLVFAELTKSKRGADYIALFVYFQFKAAIRVLLAEGPRQVINAITLYSVGQANFVDKNTKGLEGFVRFWANVEALGERNRNQAIVLFTMLFTLVIWAFSAICFLTACLLHVFFLWHYVPKQDGSLSRYCRRKINRRLGRIVNAKVEKAMLKREAAEKKQHAASLKSEGSSFQPPSRAATLPIIPANSPDPSTVLSPTTTLSSSETFLSRAPTRSGSITSSTLTRKPTLPDLYDGVSRPPPPVRSQTESSAMSSSSAGSGMPLVRGAAAMGLSPPSVENIQPTLPNLNMHEPIKPSPPHDFIRPAYSHDKARKLIPMQTIQAGGTPTPSPQCFGATNTQWSRPPALSQPSQGDTFTNFNQSAPGQLNQTWSNQEGFTNGRYWPQPPAYSVPMQQGAQSSYRPYSPFSGLSGQSRAPLERSTTFADMSRSHASPAQMPPPFRRVGTAPATQDAMYADDNYNGSTLRHPHAGFGSGPGIGGAQ